MCVCVSVCVYIYIYICVCVCVCVYIYIQKRIRWKFVLKKEDYDNNVASKLLKEATVDIIIIILMRFFHR